MSYEELTAVYRPSSGDWGWREEANQSLQEPHALTLWDDIEANGITNPVLLGSDGRVWDGHRRIVIAGEVGVEIPYEIVEGDQTNDCPN